MDNAFFLLVVIFFVIKGIWEAVKESEESPGKLSEENKEIKDLSYDLKQQQQQGAFAEKNKPEEKMLKDKQTETALEQSEKEFRKVANKSYAGQKANNRERVVYSDEVDSSIIEEKSVTRRKRRRKTLKERRRVNRKAQQIDKTNVPTTFTRSDLVQGVIFKEILGEPRAKKPHRTSNYR